MCFEEAIAPVLKEEEPLQRTTKSQEIMQLDGHELPSGAVRDVPWNTLSKGSKKSLTTRIKAEFIDVIMRLFALEGRHKSSLREPRPKSYWS